MTCECICGLLTSHSPLFLIIVYETSSELISHFVTWTEPHLCTPFVLRTVWPPTPQTQSQWAHSNLMAGVITLEDGAPAEINTNRSGSQMWKRNLPQEQNNDVTDISTTCFYTRSLLALPPSVPPPPPGRHGDLCWFPLEGVSARWLNQAAPQGDAGCLL